MSLKDIEKLRERTDKDPNSKLFVPLAEEYRKEGMLDEAIAVLLDGIGRQPGYVSARVSLGKMYLEKGLQKEARAEFENVVKSIPDNLYAHKKLAEIYRNSGDSELARKSYLTVLKLNSMDEEALTSLQELDSGELEQASANEPQVVPPTRDELPSYGEVEAAELPETETDSPPDDFQAQQSSHEDEFAIFKNSLFGSAEHATDSDGEEIIAEDEDLKSMPGEPDEVAYAEFAFQGEAEEVPGDASASFEESIPTEPEAETDGIEEIEIEEPFEDSPYPAFESGFAASQPDAAATETGDGSGAGATEPLRVIATLDGANREIEAGNYSGAMKIYRKILLSSPDDKKTLQRVEELKSLLRMLGKEKEFLVARLTDFLDGVQKRRDGFRRSS